MPEHSSTDLRPLGVAMAASASTGRQLPSVKSAGWQTATLLRSIDFGVITISGRCISPSACWRSMWKWLAGVDGWQTVIASSAASCSQRSIRAEEWSGPWPS